MLGEDALHELAVDVGESVVATLEAVGEPRVIEAKEVQEHGVHIMHVHHVFDRIEPEVVGLAVDVAGFDAAAR